MFHVTGHHLGPAKAPIKLDYFMTFQWFFNFENQGNILQGFFRLIREYLNERNVPIYNFPLVAIKSQR